MRPFILFLSLFLMTGCTQVKQMQHMDELLVLKSYSEEKEAQGKWIDQEQKKFERLLAIVKDGSIKRYDDQSSIVHDFGKPVVVDSVVEGDQTFNRWLYRHPIQRLANERVYLYFDDKGRLKNSRNVPASSMVNDQTQH